MVVPTATIATATTAALEGSQAALVVALTSYIVLQMLKSDTATELASGVLTSIADTLGVKQEETYRPEFG